ncbi:MAG: DNA primase [Acidimicrobiales bacterium]
MGIVDEDIGRVRETADIVQVITQYTQLKRVGRRFSGLCPFHGEKSPSFSVNAEEGLYYCFGCGVKGDVITFVREKEQLDFVGAVEWLSNKFGVQLHYTDKNEGEDRKRKARLHDAIREAVEWYHKRLLSGADSKAARGYLRHRGYDGETVRQYKIGYAPDAWDHLAKSLRMPDNDWIDSGLGNLNRHGGKYDFFRGRVLFPIFDAQDQAMGFGGRILPGSDDNRKYVNSADSAVYSKSRVLYGLNWAKTDVVAADEVIVCEGYTDVIGFAQAGVSRAVATCGTALTEDHVKLLSKFAKRVVLSFDADAAGQNAAAKFYEWEKKYSLDVAVANLPDGVDPGDLARSDPARLAAAVSGAKPFLGFRVDRALDAGDLSTVEGRAKAAEAALEMVAEHPDAHVRDAYAMEIAAHCRMNEELIRQQLAAGPRRSGPVIDLRHNQRQQPRSDTPEFEALRLAVTRRDDMTAYLAPELFLDEMCATAYHVLTQTESVHRAIEVGGAEVGELLQRVSVEDSDAEPLDVASLLWRQYVESQVEAARIRARGAVSPADIVGISAEQAWFKSRLDELLDPARSATAVAGLLAWLNQVPEETT